MTATIVLATSAPGLAASRTHHHRAMSHYAMNHRAMNHRAMNHWAMNHRAMDSYARGTSRDRAMANWQQNQNRYGEYGIDFAYPTSAPSLPYSGVPYGAPDRY
jgi:uncharacterized protein involved in copper resistance